MKKILLSLFLVAILFRAQSQNIHIPKALRTDSMKRSALFSEFAKVVIAKYKEPDRVTYLDNLFKLQLVAKEYGSCLESLNSCRSAGTKDPRVSPLLENIRFELYAKSMQASTNNQPFEENFRKRFRDLHNTLDDKAAFYISTEFTSRNGVASLLKDFKESLIRLTNGDSIGLQDAVGLCKRFLSLDVYRVIEPLVRPLLIEDDQRRYVINDTILIETNDGIKIHAISVRKKGISPPQPTILVYTIYAQRDDHYSADIWQAKMAAAYGYPSLIAFTRGKGLSPNEVVPYEKESNDVNEVIGWIVKQPWSNGEVGMYGGSYNGFSQWAATKKLHPGLKTIVPYVAAVPGLGLPMENNVFLNANYGWAFYVSNNKFLDNRIYEEPQRWNSMMNRWYTSGAPYRKIDSIEGTPNRFLQRWLDHPSYDSYWQNMVPYKTDFSKINIPVLSVTGYYDDGQISAIQYLKEHHKYNKNANHYLIIGPYDHFGAQRGGIPVLRDYKVDPVALINLRQITFEWFDYIFRNGAKPAILKDKINYQEMGTNEWKHAPSLEKAANSKLVLYLTNDKIASDYKLSPEKPQLTSHIDQEVDLADRKSSNNDYYPSPIVRKQINRSNGLFFLSEPFEESFSINGTFSGTLKASINKRDMDIGVVLYEVTPENEYFHLSYFLGRASYSGDMSSRKLLTPGNIESISFDRTRMTSKQIRKGSRLLVVVNVDKNPFAQINYGTGKDVSDETISDAKQPLKIKWYTDSYITVPIWK